MKKFDPMEGVVVLNKRRNPMEKRIGKDPESRKCADCSHLKIMDRHGRRVFHCRLRKPFDTSPRKEPLHRKFWDACKLILPVGT